MKCKDCPHLVMQRKITSARYDCLCKHPNQDYIYEYFKENNIRKYQGFLCYSKPNIKEPTIKTAPKWCPLKESEER